MDQIIKNKRGIKVWVNCLSCVIHKSNLKFQEQAFFKKPKKSTTVIISWVPIYTKIPQMNK